MSNKIENCYFFIAEDVPENERVVRSRCVSCYRTTPEGYFWEGSRLGYGPFEFKCHDCGRIIFEPSMQENGEME